MPPILLALCLAASGFSDPSTQHSAMEPTPRAESARVTPWWSETQGGRLASFFGLGLALIAVGVVAFGKKRSLRPLWRAVVWLLLGAGSLSLLTAVVAFSGGQPYAVYYPLFLFGGLAMVVSMGLRGGIALSSTTVGPGPRADSQEK